MKQLLHASSSEDLRRQLSVFDVTVAKRSEGRTTAQTERFSIAYLLSSLDFKQCEFPLVLMAGDRPDCVLIASGKQIGIELTEAVPENSARSAYLRERQGGSSIYFLSRAVPGEPAKSSALLQHEIELDSAGTPWVGNEPEREWAAAMLYFAKTKVLKAHRPGFTLYPSNWLVIYDNWPLPAVRHVEALSIFEADCLSAGVTATFDRVFVLGSKVLCEIGQETRCTSVAEPGA